VEIFIFILIAIVSILARVGRKQKEEEARKAKQAAPQQQPQARPDVARPTLQPPPRPRTIASPVGTEGGPWFDPAPPPGPGYYGEGRRSGSTQGLAGGSTQGLAGGSTQGLAGGSPEGRRDFEPPPPAGPDYYGEGRRPTPSARLARPAPSAARQPALKAQTPAPAPVVAAAAAPAVIVRRAPLIKGLSFSGNALVYGVLYGEILGKPKALRGPLPGQRAR